jgi:hypothetical protein
MDLRYMILPEKLDYARSGVCPKNKGHLTRFTYQRPCYEIS